MKYNEAMRKQISEQSKGLIIESLTWEEDGEYWVMTFTDGSELSIRLMAEIECAKGASECLCAGQ